VSKITNSFKKYLRFLFIAEVILIHKEKLKKKNANSAEIADKTDLIYKKDLKPDLNRD
jgi:hypothetical protein